MSLSALPQPIKAFLQATASRDRAALLASYADDAVLIDMGEEHRAAMKSLAGPTASISARTSACIRFTPRSDLAGDRIGRLRMVAAHGGRETGPAGSRPWLRACYQHVRSRRHGLALRAGRDRKQSDAPLRGPQADLSVGWAAASDAILFIQFARATGRRLDREIRSSDCVQPEAADTCIPFAL
jgi:hypothetical protein